MIKEQRIWVCDVCNDYFFKKVVGECPTCKRYENEYQEWLKKYSAICPECQGKNDVCMWCQEGRVTPETEQWLKRTTICPVCDGDPVLSVNYTCNNCTQGRLPKNNKKSLDDLL